MANTKERIYNELFKELANDTECVAEIDQVIKYMTDYFNTDELAGFLEHVKEEREVNYTVEDETEDDKMKLYARDIKGNIKQWDIALIEDSNCAKISTGRLNGNLIDTFIDHLKIENEIASRIAKKRKEGYVSLKDLGFMLPSVMGEYQDFLVANLPKCNTDANNNLKPIIK